MLAEPEKKYIHKESFCMRLGSQIVDEKQAVKDYANLKGAGSLEDAIIESIMKDEAKHAELLRAIEKKVCYG